MKPAENALLLAAKFIEADVRYVHPLDALVDASPSRAIYYKAARLVHRVCGLDLMDLDRDEMIDWLTGVALGEF